MPSKSKAGWPPDPPVLVVDKAVDDIEVDAEGASLRPVDSPPFFGGKQLTAVTSSCRRDAGVVSSRDSLLIRRNLVLMDRRTVSDWNLWKHSVEMQNLVSDLRPP